MYARADVAEDVLLAVSLLLIAACTAEDAMTRRAMSASERLLVERCLVGAVADELPNNGGSQLDESQLPPSASWMAASERGVADEDEAVLVGVGGHVTAVEAVVVVASSELPLELPPGAAL